MLELDASIRIPDPLPADPVAPSVPLDAFSGTYESERYGRFDIVVDGDALRVEAGPAGHLAALPYCNRDTFLRDWGSVTSLPDPTMFVIGPDGIAVEFENGSLDRATD